MTKTKYRLIYTGATSSSLALLASPVIARAACDLNNPAGGIRQGAECAVTDTQPQDLNTNIKNITNTLLLVIGIAAVIMLIIGGFRYVFSAGDPAATKGAKDTIIYAIVGIIVALLAFAIVNFVLARFGA